MSLKLIAPDKKLTLTKQELQAFGVFLEKQKTAAFTGIYNFKTVNKEREELYKLILDGFAEKIVNKLISNYHQFNSKKIKVNVSAVEEKTLITVLRRIQHKDDNAYTMAVTEGIMFQLKPIKNEQIH